MREFGRLYTFLSATRDVRLRAKTSAVLRLLALGKKRQLPGKHGVEVRNWEGGNALGLVPFEMVGCEQQTAAMARQRREMFGANSTLIFDLDQRLSDTIFEDREINSWTKTGRSFRSFPGADRRIRSAVRSSRRSRRSYPTESRLKCRHCRDRHRDRGRDGHSLAHFERVGDEFGDDHPDHGARRDSKADG